MEVQWDVEKRPEIWLESILAGALTESGEEELVKGEQHGVPDGIMATFQRQQVAGGAGKGVVRRVGDACGDAQAKDGGRC